MVSYSFVFLIAAVLALSQVALAAPSYPPPCKEIHPKSEIRLVKPYFTPGQSGNIIRKQWKADDNTQVLLKHLYENDGTLLLIKTKERSVRRIELGFQVNGDQVTKRHFKLKKNHSCYVPSIDANSDNDLVSVNSVSYYKRV